MKPAKKSVHLKRRGAVLIISMIFILIFSALAVSMATLSDTNVQLASNQHKVNSALLAAQSGLDITRFWLSRVLISGKTNPADRFQLIIASLNNDLQENGISNISTYSDGSSVIIPSVPLDLEAQQSFSATITPIDVDTCRVDVTGQCGSITRTIRVIYQFDETANTVFDFGVATKGPLSLSGNIELDGVNVSVDASVYIESENSNLALSIIGNSQIAGDVKIVNPIASVNLQGGQAGIGGETGTDAIDNHVEFGVPPSSFPEPNPGDFAAYATNILDPNTDTSADATFENLKIPAGLNPTFSGHVTLKGIVFIEPPNVVTFTGTTDVTAIIVGNGSIEEESVTNQLIFLGTVNSNSVNQLPNEEQFEEIRSQTGTFVMAPGFQLSFGGDFETINGAIAGSGITFSGNAGGTICGSVINYSDEQMDLSGNSDLYFNRSGVTECPAGFVPELVLLYNPESYSEVTL